MRLKMKKQNVKHPNNPALLFRFTNLLILVCYVSNFGLLYDAWYTPGMRNF